MVVGGDFEPEKVLKRKIEKQRQSVNSNMTTNIGENSNIVDMTSNISTMQFGTFD